MLFNSYVFMLAFLPLTLLGYFLLGRLPERIRRTPRWRMLYLRAVIDHELAANGFALSNSKRGTEALRELYGIYHCTPQTHHWVCPPLEQKT